MGVLLPLGLHPFFFLRVQVSGSSAIWMQPGKGQEGAAGLSMLLLTGSAEADLVPTPHFKG